MTVSDSKWVMLKGLVVAASPQRRADGSSGFKISLLVIQAADDSTPVVRSTMNWFTPPLRGLRRFGLN
jgi:hypothetical protein